MNSRDETQVRALNENEFKEVMSRFATGVAIVTTQAEGSPHGSTVQAFCSVSLNPQLVLVCLSSNGRTVKKIESSGRFAVNFLGLSQKELAEIFANPSLSPEQRFKFVRYDLGVTGCPIIRGSIAVVECALKSVYTEGDHKLLIGEVVSGGTLSDEQPLLYYKHSYTTVK
jgi:flavin reductase (DIM6/NTAB) family NADH-FMN oxidoreductase RutF